MDYFAGGAEREAIDFGEWTIEGEIEASEVELFASDEIDGLADGEGFVGEDGGVSADEADGEVRILIFESFGEGAVALEGGGAGMNDDEFVVAGDAENITAGEVIWGGVEQAGAFDERGWLGEPSGIPERADLAFCLVAGACAAIEAFPGRWVDEESFTE